MTEILGFRKTQLRVQKKIDLPDAAFGTSNWASFFGAEATPDSSYQGSLRSPYQALKNNSLIESLRMPHFFSTTCYEGLP